MKTTIQHNEGRHIISPAFDDGTVSRAEPEYIKFELQRAIAVAMATTTAAAEATAEIIRLTTRPSFPIREQQSAVLIQTAFRGYLVILRSAARNALFNIT